MAEIEEVWNMEDIRRNKRERILTNNPKIVESKCNSYDAPSQSLLTSRMSKIQNVELSFLTNFLVEMIWDLS